MSEQEEGPVASGLHGRRKGKPLSARRDGLMRDLLPSLLLDLKAPAPSDARALFPLEVAEIGMEIGFGGGEHLLSEAARNPKTGFIGVEPFVNGMAKALAAIADGEVENIRLFDSNAALVLDWLPRASLSRIDLLYPDPWPKTRHWKRRFLSGDNLDKMARALRPGGSLRIASDIASYIEWTLAHILRREDFSWTAKVPQDWQKPWPLWPGTRYEAKAIREGRTPAYLAFQRH